MYIYIYTVDDTPPRTIQNLSNPLLPIEIRVSLQSSETSVSMEAAEVGSIEEQIDESFVCCICLELLYKPVVLSCGHIACFWCAHKSMSWSRESHCPICRNAYNHFPTICQMFHFLLQKLYPVAYKTRELQVLEEENSRGHFSPQFGSSVTCTNTPEEAPNASFQSSFENQQSRTCKRITVEDVLCTGCKQLLFRPAVLNCGHVYCESCLVHRGNEMIRCQDCQSLHPNGLPKVFLELVRFLEEHFPDEYALRKDTTQHKEVDFKGPTEAGNQAVDPPSSASHRTIVHLGVGCDFCGMYPITGDRFKCIDCKESIGFDLCSNCYNTPFMLPGRFNQQHTSEHKFVLVQSGFRAPVEFILDGFTSALTIRNYMEESDDGSTPLSLTSSTDDNTESGGSTPNSSSGGGLDQEDSQSTT